MAIGDVERVLKLKSEAVNDDADADAVFESHLFDFILSLYILDFQRPGSMLSSLNATQDYSEPEEQTPFTSMRTTMIRLHSVSRGLLPVQEGASRLQKLCCLFVSITIHLIFARRCRT